MALCQSANNMLQATAVTYRVIGSGKIDTFTLISAVVGGEWSASRLGRGSGRLGRRTVSCPCGHEVAALLNQLTERYVSVN